MVTKWLPPSLAACQSLKSVKRLVILLEPNMPPPTFPESDEKSALSWVMAQLHPAELSHRGKEKEREKQRQKHRL